VTDEREIESFLRMAGRATAIANTASDPWLKAQWMEIAGAYRQVAQSRRQAAVPASRRAPGPVEGGKDDG
jgi:hypothetical protein